METDLDLDWEVTTLIPLVRPDCEETVTSKVVKNKIPIYYAALLLMASGFLFATAVIFLLLWKKHNIYNWTIFCEVIANLFMILFIAIANTLAREPDSPDLGSLHCTFIGAAAHFFYLSTFFWLITINFDLWWSFRSLKPMRSKSKGWYRFIVYQFFGWGIPLLIVGLGFILDSFYGVRNGKFYNYTSLNCTNIIVPNYGQLNCYFAKAAQGPYLYYPMGAILVINLVLFIMTVVTVYNYRRDTQAILHGASTNQTKALGVLAKLFVVMGVSWIFEIIAWIFHSKVPKSKSQVPWYWIVFDVVILLQAIAIFLMFVCKRQVFNDLWHTYPALRPLLSPIARLSCCAVIPQRQSISSIPAARSDGNLKLRSPSTPSEFATTHF